MLLLNQIKIHRLDFFWTFVCLFVCAKSSEVVSCHCGVSHRHTIYFSICHWHNTLLAMTSLAGSDSLEKKGGKVTLCISLTFPALGYIGHLDFLDCGNINQWYTSRQVFSKWSVYVRFHTWNWWGQKNILQLQNSRWIFFLSLACLIRCSHWE